MVGIGPLAPPLSRFRSTRSPRGVTAASGPSGQRTGQKNSKKKYRENRENGKKKLAVTSQYTVRHNIDDYLLPRWGPSFALDIQPLDIEQWLGSLKRSNPTKDKIRRIMSVVYTRAQKYGLVPRSEASNPVGWVEQSANKNLQNSCSG